MISLIAAIQQSDDPKYNLGLGFQNDLLYKIHDDLTRFKELTTGHPIIMGRKTFESIGRALPNRTNIVITSTPATTTDGVIFVKDTDEAVRVASEAPGNETIYIIGGAQIYNLFLEQADELLLTLIPGEKEADVFFPDFAEKFSEISSEQLLDQPTNQTYFYKKFIRK